MLNFKTKIYSRIRCSSVLRYLFSKSVIRYTSKIQILTSTGHFLRILWCPEISRITSAFRESIIRRLAVSWTRFALMRSSLVFELANRALIAHLFIRISLITRFAVASSSRKIPFAISLAEECWLLDFHRISNTDSFGLFNKGHFPASGRFWKVGEVHGDFWTTDVVDLNRQDRDASSLISKGEVDSFFGHWDWFHLSVDYHFCVGVKPPFASRNSTWKTILRLELERGFNCPDKNFGWIPDKNIRALVWNLFEIYVWNQFYFIRSLSVQIF